MRPLTLLTDITYHLVAFCMQEFSVPLIIHIPTFDLHATLMVHMVIFIKDPPLYI